MEVGPENDDDRPFGCRWYGADAPQRTISVVIYGRSADEAWIRLADTIINQMPVLVSIQELTPLLDYLINTREDDDC